MLQQIRTVARRASLASVLGLAFLMLGAQGASATSLTTFVDIDSHGGMKLSAGLSAPSYLLDMFDVTTSGIEGDSYQIGFPYTLAPYTVSDQGGFTPGVHTAVDATFFVAVRDDFDPLRTEYMEVSLGGLSSGSLVEVDFQISSLGVDAVLFANLNATGQLGYAIQATRGDFRVDYTALRVVASSPSYAPAVPEPLAAGAFAAGLVVLAAAIRRR